MQCNSINIQPLPFRNITSFRVKPTCLCREREKRCFQNCIFLLVLGSISDFIYMFNDNSPTFTNCKCIFMQILCFSLFPSQVKQKKFLLNIEPPLLKGMIFVKTFPEIKCNTSLIGFFKYL